MPAIIMILFFIVLSFFFMYITSVISYYCVCKITFFLQYCKCFDELKYQLFFQQLAGVRLFFLYVWGSELGYNKVARWVIGLTTTTIVVRFFSWWFFRVKMEWGGRVLAIIGRERDNRRFFTCFRAWECDEIFSFALY